MTTELSLDTTVPADSVAVSEIPSYIRALKLALSVLNYGDSIRYHYVELCAIANTITVGDDLYDVKLELVDIIAACASTIEYILGGTAGQIKIFVFRDDNVTFRDGVKADGKIYLNQLPALSDYNAETNDVLALVNIGGDGTDATPGYWIELFRKPAVK